MPEYYAGMGGGNRFKLTFRRLDPSLALPRIKYESSGAPGCVPRWNRNFSYNSLGRKRRLQ